MVFVVASALLGVTVVSSRLLPRALHGRAWVFAHPRTGLALWSGSLLIGVVALAAAAAYVVAAALRMAAHPSTTPLSACDCVNAAGVYVLGWVLTAVVGGLGCFAIYAATTQAVRHARLRRSLTTALLAEATEEFVAGCWVMVYPHPHPLALGVPGRPRMIAISASLRGLLDERELTTVLSHERAHLRQRHTVLMQLAAVHRACLPHSRGARRFESAMRVLVELAADDAAARRHGVAVTAAALRNAATLDASIALRAERLELRRRLAPTSTQAERERDLASAAAPAIRPNTPATRPA